MFCQNCGAQAGDGNFCGKCGSKITREADSPVLPSEAPTVPDPSANQASTSPGQPLPQPTPTPGPSAQDTTPTPWYKRKAFIIPVAIFVGLAFIVALVDDGEPEVDASSQSEQTSQVDEPAGEPEPQPAPEEPAAPEPEPSNETPETDAVEPEETSSTADSSIPATQASFISTFEEYIDLYSSAETELQAATFLNERDAELCSITGQGQVNGWVGQVHNVGANGDGKGVLEIEIGPDLTVKTWNNAFSDILDETLIEPGTPLFDSVLPLVEGDTVEFSGAFVEGSNHCLKDSRLTDYGRATDPAFIFKFSDVTAR